MIDLLCQSDCSSFGQSVHLLSSPQGAKDPLQDAKGRAREMDRLCPNVQVTLVDGGHCPFDEQPEFCNTELLKFIRSVARTPAPPAELSLTGH